VSLEEFLSIKKVLICVGSGGVGKTTTAASIAVKIAQMGRKVMVCTIDPARRLASSLGIKTIDNEETLVQEYGEGQLWAIMLDVKHTFDEVVSRYSKSEESRDRIFDNHYYKHVSNALSVSQEFMAIEKLYELHKSGAYDVIVLDTPPTKNTIDFLKTPTLLVSAFDDRFTKWLLKPYLAVSKKGSGLAAIAAEKIFNALGKIFGLQALKDVSEFVYVMQGMIEGFRERAGVINNVITDVSTGFIIVATAKDRSVEEALFFFKEIETMQADVISVVLNRLQWSNHSPNPETLHELLAALPDELKDSAREDLERIIEDGRSEDQNHRFLTRTIPKAIIQRIPQFPQDIHDLEGLESYAARLI
jgi:anion-transporting  ArsA/GET3 family ATPase